MLTGAGITHALTRTITGSSDEIETFIRNSNGNYWTATADNIQTAIWDLNSTGGTVWLPICDITATNAPIEVNDGIHIIGVTKNDTSGTHITGISGQNLFNINGDDGMTSSGSIRNLALSQPDSTGIGIKIYQASFFVVENCLITRFEKAIEVSNNSYHCKILNNRLKLSEHYEIYISDFANNIEISGNDFAPKGDSSHPFSIYASEVYDNRTSHIQILNNWFEFGTGNGSHIVGGFTDSIISENSIGNTNGVGDGINISTFSNANGYLTIISNNRIQCGSNGNGIATRDGGSCNGLIIESNTISNCKNGMIFTVSGEPQINNNIIFNNDLRGIKCDITKGGGIVTNNFIKSNGDDGVYEATLVNSNKIYSNTGHGIYKCTMCSDNIIRENTDGGIYLIGDNSIVTGNKINSNTGRGLHLHGVSNNCTISNNLFYDPDGNPQTTGIDDDGDYNFICNNDFSTQGGTTIDSIGSNTIVLNNIGYNYDSLKDDYIWNSNGKYWSAIWDNAQLAVDDLGGNGTVWIPDGTFTASSTLWVNHSHVTIRGQGGTSWGEKGATIINPSVELSNGIIRVQDSTGFSIFDIKFNEGGRPSHTTHALYFSNSHAITIDRCGFHYINGSSIYLYSTCYSVDIRNCDFQECGGYYGANTFADVVIRGDATGVITDINIEDCVFEACYSYFIEDIDDAFACNPIDITGNYFEMVNTCPGAIAIKGDFKYSIIQGNYFQGINQHADAIYLNPGDAYTRIVDNHFVNWDDTLDITGNYVTVEDNFIKDSGDDAIANIYPYGIVKGNTIIDSGGNAIYCSSRTLIEGNIIKVTGDSAINVGNDCDIIDNVITSVTGHAIVGFNRNNVTIIGNNISGVSSNGIYIESADSHVSNNDISLCSGYPIYMATGCHRSSVENNLIHNCDGAFALFVYSSNNISIQGNHLVQNDSTPAYGLRLGTEATRDLYITDNIFDGWDTNIITAYNGCTLANQTILNNFGYDNSTYQYFPCSATSPYTSPSDGAMYFNSDNQTIAVYWDSQWWYYDHL